MKVSHALFMIVSYMSVTSSWAIDGSCPPSSQITKQCNDKECTYTATYPPEGLGWTSARQRKENLDNSRPELNFKEAIILIDKKVAPFVCVYSSAGYDNKDLRLLVSSPVKSTVNKDSNHWKENKQLNRWSCVDSDPASCVFEYSQ
ncbi:DUF3757 domain-containing protein [Candidatus Fukatsuia symbiotica]|uniref:DUF3757 domain-containing protein n=2 Tax=Yersiniaceae TaxID=1903411 RepID=A0A2U8I345_9GAMM|nr:DUF3757 domain-containing protein [Candidatus Fukatsuia symbiotica]AWK13529.1 hypothetical protein CCS41_01845 [Candidatus Fukatsuia symbiotica]AWK13745.1 hypothetical protein CCS41_03445 [Candidatus Fukatsuia symbiotica]MEA9444434.1 DUF3757 domain-containing protein [Candidatus Fukatsuia symbiotica]